MGPPPMLELLRIRNLALIADLELEFSPGLNVLTGETGAGKSFILKAVNFLTGDKLSPDMVRHGADKATVDAIFVTGQGEQVLRRELTAETGRSRLYLNDDLCRLETVQALKPNLVLHVGQHGQQRLLSPAYQAKLLDGFLDDPSLLKQRDELAAQWKSLTARRQELETRVAELSERRELLEFQKQEIDKVGPLPGEEDELLERRTLLRAQLSAAGARDAALDLLCGGEHGGLANHVAELAKALDAMAPLDPELGPEAERLTDAREHLQDLERRLRRFESAAGEDNLESIEARLYELAQLKRRLKRDLDGILHLSREIADNLSFLDAAGLDAKRLEREESELRQRLASLLQHLNTARRAAGERFCARVAAELHQLGFEPHVQVVAEFSPREVVPGLDEDVGRLLWVPNPGQAPQPLDRIASGGELSRFLLAVTRLLSQEAGPTLIFDEIDAGIGGLTLTRVAQRLQELSGQQQVILITHWPQLAAKAARHFQVRKSVEHGTTTTTCLRLKPDEVFAELSRMAGGGEHGAALAKELLA